MRLHVYRGDQLEGIFEYDQATTSSDGDERLGTGGEREHGPALSALALADVPSDWLQWAATIIFPALASGAFVRWQI